MAQVKILIEGFTSAENGDGQTCPTITLVRDGNLVMVIDPGVLENQQILIDALVKEDLKISDINYVFITHSHLDHYRNIGMFADAKTIEYFGIWDKGECQDRLEQLTDDLKIIQTPGHNYDALSLLVKTEAGIVAVVGDVFWQQNLPAVDPYATDSEKLTESRQKVLALADYIVPGHGPMYKVRK
ncbi:MAG: MBL fold metallo-hydrolase [Candidatus Buchananbacteria bacterium]